MKTEQYVELNTGARMPIIGLGTWKSPKDKAGQAVEYALTEAGYHHIDCAAIYMNEMEIGESLARVFKSGKVKREDVFITSKLWNTEHAPDDVVRACQYALKDLQLDYLDLYLMHWSVATLPEEGMIQLNARGEPTHADGSLMVKSVSVRETWEAMEGLMKAGLVRAIGVANFGAPAILDLLTYAKTRPAVNQIELHPYHQQSKLVEFCQHRDIAVTAFSPLGSSGNVRAWGKGDPIVIEDRVIIDIAQTHQKTTAQVLIRWAMQRGTVVIPKSVTPVNIKSNMEVFDFELSSAEMELIRGLDRHHRYVDPWEWWKIPYFD